LKAAARDAILISESALVPLGSNNFVYLVKNEKDYLVVERKQIQIGERLPGAVEVKSGLAVGDKVVTHGLQKIRAGQRISILSEEPSITEHLREATHLSDLLSKQTQ